MSEEQKRILQQQLWAICNLLRGRISGDDYRDYILGFIFYKFLSERLYSIAQEALAEDGLDYANLKEDNKEHAEIIDAVREEAIANVLTTADQEIDALQKRLGHLKQEKKALMQQLLTGKRRVTLN